MSQIERTLSILRKKSVFIFFPIIIFAFCQFISSVSNSSDEWEKNENDLDGRKDFKAFITSSYYYPKSKSLGDNALALVMTINQRWAPNKNLVKQPDVIIKATNETNTIVTRTKYIRVTPHQVCDMITVFVTVQLLPNVNSLTLISGNGSVAIPFEVPPAVHHDVVVCISPLFISEQWQNFLFAVHIYKKFGAFMNLYLISAVDSFYYLMKEYEKENYLTIQPWVSAKLNGVPSNVADPYNEIEFRNQAAAQSDCLLKYKETAKYATFLDLDDILVPRLAPSYLEEFDMIARNRKVFLHYHKENHAISTVNNGEKFSFSKMFRSLKHLRKRETGKIVLDPRVLNYTWIHWPPTMPEGVEKIIVADNEITHLKNVRWVDQFGVSPRSYSGNFKPMENALIEEIEEDWMRMKNKSKILNQLPKDRFYYRIIETCYREKYYKFDEAQRINEMDCPGPQLCLYPQREDTKCIHVDATYEDVPELEPISYYYATNPRFSDSIGCYPH